MKSLVLTLSLAIVILGLTTLSPAANLDKPLRVTLLLEHNLESTWSSLLKQGLTRAAQQFPIQTKIVVCQDQDKQESVFRQAAQNSDLVLIATDQFHEILRDNAANFRQTQFGVIDAGIRGSNISCISFADEQAAFLAGAAAALWIQAQKSKTISEASLGWLSGADIPAMRSMFNGFQEGAKLINPQVKVLQGVANSFDDLNSARLETERLLKAGVKVLVLAAGPGNAEALKLAKEAQIFVIGLDSDQKALYPGHVLLSIQKKVDEAVYNLVVDSVSGHFKGKEIEIYDLKKGLSVTDPKESLGFNYPILATINRRIKELTQEILHQGIHLKSLRAKTLCNCL